MLFFEEILKADKHNSDRRPSREQILYLPPDSHSNSVSPHMFGLSLAVQQCPPNLVTSPNGLLSLMVLQVDWTLLGVPFLGCVRRLWTGGVGTAVWLPHLGGSLVGICLGSTRGPTSSFSVA